MNDRWTIRNVEPSARELVEEVHAVTGIPYGRLVSEALEVWYATLPPDDGETLLGVRRDESVTAVS